MKKNILLVFTILSLISCEKNVIGDFGGEAAAAIEPELEEIVLTEEQKLQKRGVAYTNKGATWSSRTSQLKGHWLYSWGLLTTEAKPDNIEFVPMLWGGGVAGVARLAELQAGIDDGTIKYVLGFNEPDGEKQANMTVDRAIELWPELEKLGVPLGSPATVDPLNDWMTEFMQKAEEKNLRIDFVTVHSYGGANANGLITKLQNTYAAYNRPIWITEFAVADWNATTAENNRYSETQVMNFMAEVLPQLDALDWIHRYAWFDGGKNIPLISSRLFDEDSKITPLGELYASFNPNNDIGPGKDPVVIPPVVDPDELLVNGNFETGKIEPWKGFKNGIVSGDNARTGGFAGRIEANDGSLLAVPTVQPGKTYILSFYSKWQEAGDKSFAALIRNNDGNDLLFRLPEMPLSTDWKQTTYEFTVPDGVTELKLSFYKGKVTPTFKAFFMDDVSLKEKK